MNLYQLYYFQTTAKLQHFTKAAKELSLTQPSLSHAIAALEDELGVALFEKHGRNVRLTKYGERFLPYVETAIQEIENGASTLREMSDSDNRTISLGFIYTLSSHFIPQVINGFKSNIDNQHIHFSIKEGSTDRPCTGDLVRGLKEGKLDIIFASLIPDDPAVEFIHVCDQNLVALLPIDSPLASKPTIDLRDTVPYSLINYRGKMGLKQEISQLFEMINMVPNISCEVEDEPSMANFVSANMGIAIIPDNPTIRHYPIQVRPISYPSYTRKIYVGYMKNRYQTESVQKFIDYVLTAEMPFCKCKLEEVTKNDYGKEFVIV